MQNIEILFKSLSCHIYLKKLNSYFFISNVKNKMDRERYEKRRKVLMEYLCENCYERYHRLLVVHNTQNYGFKFLTHPNNENMLMLCLGKNRLQQVKFEINIDLEEPTIKMLIR
jgi:hypothetical protein